MKALFYDKFGKIVWECLKDASYHFHNGTKAIQKGAVRAELYLIGSDFLVQSCMYTPAEKAA